MLVQEGSTQKDATKALPSGAGVSTHENVSAGAPMVRSEGLRKRFGDVEVLKGIDLTVGRGEAVSIIGPSGSGKSTMLRCLNYLEEPTGGSIYIDGKLLGYEERNGIRRPMRGGPLNAMRAEIG